MKIIQKRYFFFFLSISLVILSILLIWCWGFKKGIDFSGGVLMEFSFSENSPEKRIIEEELKEFNLNSLSVQVLGEKNILIRFISDEDVISDKIENKIKDKFKGAELKRVEFVSSVISSELKKKAFYAIFFALIGILVYIAWAFRKVSYPVESWKYGLAAIIALVHDILITMGFFAFFGKKYGIEINLSFIAALLTILGYSVNDTIVVFDRIRENITKAGLKEQFEEIVNKSIRETIARSINTSLTVLLVLLSIILFGGKSIQSFALALFIGIFFGTYSSIFVASALLLEFWKLKAKRT